MMAKEDNAVEIIEVPTQVARKYKIDEKELEFDELVVELYNEILKIKKAVA